MARRILPSFLIIGTPRSGTTSLARYLGAHPEAFMCGRKELHYFDLHYDRGLDWYARQFARAGGKRAVGEATPQYIYVEEALARIAQVLPEAKLIVLLRNPVDRAYSHYWYRRAHGLEDRPFDEIVAAELPALSTHLPLRRVYLEQGRYLKYLEQVCRYFPRDALHVEIFEDLRDSPARVYASVCRFLGVAEGFRPPNLGQAVNRFVQFRSLRARSLINRLPRSPRNLLARLNVRDVPYPPLSPGLRARLDAAFAPDTAALTAWLGRDLSVWSRPAPTATGG